jgi:hypothetical protein
LQAKSAALLLDTCLVAESLLKACLDKYDTMARSKAAAALLAKKPAKTADAAAPERQSLASTSAAAADDSEEETGKSKRGVKKGRKGHPLKFAESEDEEDEGKGGKGGRKGRRNRAGKAGGSGTGATSKTREEGTDGAPTDREMESSLLEWYPDLEGVGAGTDAKSLGAFQNTSCYRLAYRLVSLSTVGWTAESYKTFRLVDHVSPSAFLVTPCPSKSNCTWLPAFEQWKESDSRLKKSLHTCRGERNTYPGLDRRLNWP